MESSHERIYLVPGMIHIIDLQKTLNLLKAYDFIKEIVSDGVKFYSLELKNKLKKLLGRKLLNVICLVNSRWLGWNPN